MFSSKWYLYLAGLLAVLLFYKRKRDVDFEEGLKRLLRWLLRKKIEQMQEEKGKYK